MEIFENWTSRATIEVEFKSKHGFLLRAWYKGNPSDPFFQKEYSSYLSARRALTCLDRSGGKWNCREY